MKKILFALVAALFVVQVVSAEEVITQDVNVLPAKARTFVSDHFGNATVSKIKVDDGMLRSKKYEVTFTNGAEIEFNEDGDWKEIEMKNQAIPAAIVPAYVSDYVTSNFSNVYIDKIKMENNGLKVELSNDVEVEFDKDGKFKKMDD